MYILAVFSAAVGLLMAAASTNMRPGSLASVAVFILGVGMFIAGAVVAANDWDADDAKTVSPGK